MVLIRDRGSVSYIPSPEEHTFTCTCPEAQPHTCGFTGIYKPTCTHTHVCAQTSAHTRTCTGQHRKSERHGRPPARKKGGEMEWRLLGGRRGNMQGCWAGGSGCTCLHLPERPGHRASLHYLVCGGGSRSNLPPRHPRTRTDVPTVLSAVSPPSVWGHTGAEQNRGVEQDCSVGAGGLPTRERQ